MEIPAVPNTARIIDYWLGGSHHFPLDVETAKRFESLYHDYPKIFWTLRDYIGRTARYIKSQGIDQFVVFGAGLPTCGNVHEAVPQAKVLYTDIDTENIQLGKEILADHPNADYTFCDAKNLDTLDKSVVAQVLEPLRRLGMVFVGVCAFIPDEILADMFDKLYDWAPTGSFLALDFDGKAWTQYPKVLELLDEMDAHLYTRNPTTIEPLLGRWQLTRHGILPVAAWQPELFAQPRETGEPVFMYGCIVYKN
ncbi:hypothetical protein WA1_09015 [Scytonema hofmannii PCC 7110]|uniref:Methyltransferase n=1 Tax=Scytonema hofmannii PCC 7110 TaxID=128403 RepID=A0A139WS87_9CYAN|nr:SAM-dependent methyltransferase [Scytonema hofmannii]KYC35283.1 hypothetical protein WA1_09015 [Scytonema hofmannii PCC 7110]